MEEQIERLVEKAWQKYLATPSDQRLLVGVGGIPGSGKTTLAQTVVERLNARASYTNAANPAPASFIPMDGFHLTRAALSALPDPETAHFRRGAAFTFDAPKFLALVRSLRNPKLLSPDAPPILAPSFDHAVKDPKEDDIKILSSHRLLVLEGNYVALDQDVWRDAASLLNELWFVEVDFEVARVRLRERHLRAGIVETLEDGDRRARESDLVNGEEIVKFRLPVTEVIQSRQDGTWVHE